MYKSKQKIIGVSLASVVVLGGFAIGSWAIIDASNKMPKGDANVSYYQGLTQYLGKGALNINKMSISDWINLNYPTKMLVEGVGQQNYSIYYFTLPNQALGISETAWTQLKDPLQLLEYVNKPSSPLICKIDVTENANSYSYKVNLNSFYTGDDNPLLATMNYGFSDANKTQISSFDTTGININKKPLSVEPNAIKYDDYTIQYNATKDNNNTNYKMDVSSITGGNNIVYSWELRTTPNNNYTSFQVINTGAKVGNAQVNGIYSSYTNQTIDTTNNENAKNYKIYNITHQQYTNGTPGATLPKANYQTYWVTENENELPQLHLPNTIGLISFLPPINKQTTTN